MWRGKQKKKPGGERRKPDERKMHLGQVDSLGKSRNDYKKGRYPRQKAAGVRLGGLGQGRKKKEGKFENVVMMGHKPNGQGADCTLKVFLEEN